MKRLYRAARAACRSRGLPCRALLVALSAACVSTQLEVGSSHPAAAQTASPELPAIGRALEPSFEPVAGAAETSAPPEPHPHGSHGAVQQVDRPSAAPASPAASAEWTCPMHPEVIRSEPGKCPICGMKLQPVPPQAPPRGSP